MDRNLYRSAALVRPGALAAEVYRMGTDRQIAYVRSLAVKAGVAHIDYVALYDADHEAISVLIAELHRRIRLHRISALCRGWS